MNRLSVLFITNDSQRHSMYSFTAEFTVERDRTNATCVTRRLFAIEA